MELLAAELWELLDDFGGRWEGSATELHQVLFEREAVAVPERPEELSKLALRIGESAPVLEVKKGYRKLGGRGGKSVRVLRLAAKPLENAVGTVVTVGTESTRNDGTDGNDGNFVRKTPGPVARNDGTKATNERAGGEDPTNEVPTNATNARFEDEPAEVAADLRSYEQVQPDGLRPAPREERGRNDEDHDLPHRSENPSNKRTRFTL